MSPSRIALLIALAVPLAGTLAAQNHVVSPTVFALHEGGSNNTIPFWGAQYRYQQLHGDLKGTPRVLVGMAWRRDGTLSTTPGYGARSIDMEVSMGDGDFATYSTTFANNFVSPPTNVFVRKIVNAPDHVARPEFLPATFDFNLVFDTPVVHVGVKDLLWEAVIWSNSNTGTYALDAAAGNENSVMGGFSVSGTGCTTNNGIMKLRTDQQAVLPSSFTLAWAIGGGPGSAVAVVLTGFTNPGVPIPGLCNGEKLYTDAALVQIPGTTSSGGVLTTSTFSLPFNPNYVSFHLTAQAAALDASQGALGVAVSNGNDAVLPPLPTNFPVSRLYASNATAATGARETYSYGLVTRFTY